MITEQLWDIIQGLDDRLSKLEGLLAEEIWKSEEPIRQKERERTAVEGDRNDKG